LRSFASIGSLITTSRPDAAQRSAQASTARALAASFSASKVLEDLTGNGWTLDTPDLTRLIIEKQGEPADEKEYKTLRRRIDRDIVKLRAEN
jgi:hypothetical protein